jgi:glyoxylase-like metal-dependent hydrolase (beta-lactamase superfamily II)
MKCRVLAFCLAWLVFRLPAFGVDEFPIDFERLSPRVLVVKCGKVYTDQVVAIATQKGIVMIDTGKSPTLAAEYRKIIERELGRKDFAYVINTHYHFDHSNGNGVFAEAEIIAHESSPEKMRIFQRGLDDFIDSRRSMRARYQSQIENAGTDSEMVQRGRDVVATMDIMIKDLEADFQVTLPTMTFSDRLTLDLGDVTLKLVYFGEGRHTGDDILIHCPEEKLLFTGDLFFKGSMQIAYGPQIDAERWMDALDFVLEDMSRVETVYDTHNGPMKGSFLTLWHQYLSDLWKSAKEAREKGLDLTGVQKHLAYAPRFTYLEKSGLDREQLVSEHQASVKYMWYSVNKTESAATVLGDTLNESGIADFRDKLMEMRAAADDDRYYFDEIELNRLGYRLINQNKLDQAILVFEANVEAFPEAFNTWDSLGEAYMIKGEKELAIENYTKSLELNPDNANAVEKLKALEKQS